MATTNDLKNGIVLDLDGQLWTVIDFHVVGTDGPDLLTLTSKELVAL